MTVLSLLTAFRVLPGPEIAGVSLAFLALFIIPGLQVIYILFGRIPVTAEGFARVFFAGLVFATITLLAGAIPGAGYRSVSLSAATLSGGMAFLCFVRSGRTSAIEPRDLVGSFRNDDDLSVREKKALIILAGVMFILCFILFYGKGETGAETDAPDHISYVARSIESGRLFPEDSFFRDGDGRGFDPRKGTWHPVLALWAYQADTSAAFLWQFLPAFLAFFYLVAFWVFARELLQSIPLALLSSIFLLLLYRGGGLEWLTKSGYSKNLMQMTFWMACAYLLRYLNEGRRWCLSSAAVLAALGSSVHLVFGYLFVVTLVSIGMFTIIRDWGISWRSRFTASIPVLILSIGIPSLIRLAASGRGFNAIHTHRQGLLLFDNGLSMVDPVEILSHSGMGIFIATIIITLSIFFGDRDRRAKLCGLMFAVPVVLVLNPLTGSLLGASSGYLYYRLVDAAPQNAVLAIALVWAVRSVFASHYRTVKRRGAVAYIFSGLLPALAVIALISFSVRLSLPSFIGDIERLSGGGLGEVDARYETIPLLLEGVEEGAVVCSDPVTSYLVSAFTGKFVTSVPGQHGNPTDEKALSRLSSTRDIFSPYLPFLRSVEWIESEGIDYILVDTGYRRSEGFFDTVPAESRLDALDKFRRASPFLVEKGERDGLVLFAVDGEKVSADLPEEAIVPVREIPYCADYRSSGSGEDDPGIRVRPAAAFTETGMILDTITLGKVEVAAGDTIDGDFCWTRQGESAFGMPLEWVVRLDTPYPRGPFFREWFDKQYRRRIERTTGLFYRKTVTGRVMGGTAHPDLWESGRPVRQDFIIPVPAEMAEGDYEVRVMVRRSPYLQNRSIKDYFRNEDSMHGVSVTSVRIRRGS